MVFFPLHVRPKVQRRAPRLARFCHCDLISPLITRPFRRLLFLSCHYPSAHPLFVYPFRQTLP